MLLYVFSVFLFYLGACGQRNAQDELYVFLPHQGGFTGMKMTTSKGRDITAFLGIPYAKPPIGSLRFKSPVEPPFTLDLINANTDGNQCPQFDDNGRIVGEEDCLYLNVYTPKLYQDRLYPTMVYIHGGTFVKGNGSSTTSGPGYLLNKDVVLVTINYRLGVFGFLSTGDSVAPGNFGLKDQVLALKWVQKNIRFFGGDPKKVTIFGQAAGAASVHMHSVSKASSGLFNQFIAMSGTYLCFWAWNFIDQYKKYPIKLAEKFNCPTNDSGSMVQCLREVDARSLVDTDSIFNDTMYRFNTWGPTSEPDIPGAFLDDFPLRKTVLYGETKYPAIMGNVANNGLVFTAQLYTNNGLYEKISNNLDGFLRDVIKQSFENSTPQVYVPRFKKFYFSGIDSNDKKSFIKSTTRFISDIGIRFPYDSTKIFTANITKNIVYFYSFEYRGTFSETMSSIGTNENLGVSHSDILLYIFPNISKIFGYSDDVEMNESDKMMIDTITDFWTSFAYDGVPSTNSLNDQNNWPSDTDGEARDYMRIGYDSDPSVSRQSNYNREATLFWRDLLGRQLFTPYLYNN